MSDLKKIRDNALAVIDQQLPLCGKIAKLYTSLDMVNTIYQLKAFLLSNQVITSDIEKSPEVDEYCTSMKASLEDMAREYGIDPKAKYCKEQVKDLFVAIRNEVVMNTYYGEEEEESATPPIEEAETAEPETETAIADEKKHKAKEPNELKRIADSLCKLVDMMELMLKTAEDLRKN